MSTSTHPQAEPEDPTTDPFDTLLTLEDTLYTSAYSLGVHDGARAGRIEGRIFGLEKGFEKFAAMGHLHGRAAVWGSRIPRASNSSPPNPNDPGKVLVEEGQQTGMPTLEEDKERGLALPPLPKNERLNRNIHLLHHLTDPLTFSTENNEESVADFDDRVKRAGAKAKVIERILGETDVAPSSSSAGENAKSPARGKGKGVKMVGDSKGRKDDSMEDFAGSRLLG